VEETGIPGENHQKTNRYHTVARVTQRKIEKIIERGKTDILNTQIHRKR
jgi:hypothetical protein